MTLRDIPSELQNHLSDDSTTMANCWKVTRNDGVVFRFTDCDVEVQLSDGIYTPISSGSASAIENTADLSTANLTITQILDSEYITIDDINAGLFDGARISIYWVNYKDPGQGIITLFVGFFGEITMRDDNDFDVELKSISTKLEQTVVRQYTQQCDAELGDSRCGVSGELYTVSGEITSVVSNKKFKGSVVSGGEDYVLLLTVDKNEYEALAGKFWEEFSKPLYRIGYLEKGDPHIVYIKDKKEVKDLKEGYSHF